MLQLIVPMFEPCVVVVVVKAVLSPWKPSEQSADQSCSLTFIVGRDLIDKAMNFMTCSHTEMDSQPR